MTDNRDRRHHPRLQRLPGGVRAAGDPPLPRGRRRARARGLCAAGRRPVHRRRRVRQRPARPGGQPDRARSSIPTPPKRCTTSTSIPTTRGRTPKRRRHRPSARRPSASVSRPRSISSPPSSPSRSSTSCRRSRATSTSRPTGGDRTARRRRPATPLPRLSSRFHPLMGSYLAHFGAFFAEPFREHDFYVGIYDGLVNAAREYVEDQRRRSAAHRGRGDALGRQRPRLSRPAGASAPNAAAASYMVRRLLDTELRQAVSPEVGLRVRRLLDGGGVTLDAWLRARDQLKESESPPRIPFLRVLIDVLSCESEAGKMPPGLRAGRPSPSPSRTSTEVVDHLREALAAGARKVRISISSTTTSAGSCAGRRSGFATRRSTPPSGSTRSSTSTATRSAST